MPRLSLLLVVCNTIEDWKRELCITFVVLSGCRQPYERLYARPSPTHIHTFFYFSPSYPSFLLSHSSLSSSTEDITFLPANFQAKRISGPPTHPYPILSFCFYQLPTSTTTPPSATPQSETKMAISPFFASYPTFTPNPTAPIQREYHRLACQMHWSKKVYKRNRAACYSAELASHWEDLCGDEGGYEGYDTKLECWQSLCEELGVLGKQGSITRCREVCTSSPVYSSSTTFLASFTSSSPPLVPR